MTIAGTSSSISTTNHGTVTFATTLLTILAILISIFSSLFPLMYHFHNYHHNHHSSLSSSNKNSLSLFNFLPRNAMLHHQNGGFDTLNVDGIDDDGGGDIPLGSYSKLQEQDFYGLFSDTDPQMFNHSLWDNLLKQYVSRGHIHGVDLTVVDYPGLRTDLNFYFYLNMLSRWNISNMTRDEELALYINAYNAYAIKVVVENPCKVRFGRYCYPVKSIWDTGTVNQNIWSTKIANIGGQILTLDEIETHLRKMGDPRIHACIVCASVSCPNLRIGAFFPDVIRDQLAQQMMEFLANPTKGFQLDQHKETIHISNIFNWYKADFDDYMKHLSNGTLKDFIITNVPKKYQAFLLIHQDSLIIDYIPYNWRLNNKYSQY